MNEIIEVEIHSNSVLTVGDVGAKFKLVFSQSMILLNDEDKITVKLPESYDSFEIDYLFLSNSEKEKYSGSKSSSDNRASFEFYNWKSSSYVESIDPAIIKRKDGNWELYSKVRTISHPGKISREVTITIWERLSQEIN